MRYTSSGGLSWLAAGWSADWLVPELGPILCGCVSTASPAVSEAASPGPAYGGLLYSAAQAVCVTQRVVPVTV